MAFLTLMASVAAGGRLNSRVFAKRAALLVRACGSNFGLEALCRVPVCSAIVIGALSAGAACVVPLLA